MGMRKLNEENVYFLKLQANSGQFWILNIETHVAIS
jgi:hypothetical protein